MSDIDLETATLKITLGDIIQQFTEEDLQKEMPVFMQDIDADTKEFIDTYQLYLSEGNFLEAESYRNSHPELETRIWDSFKANAFMAYAAFVYLYAKDKKQQCILSEIVPPSGNGEDIIGQVEGDIWFRIDGIKDGVINTTPFRKLEDGTYQEFAVAPKLEFAIKDDIEEIYNDEITDLTNPEALINVENLKLYTLKVKNELKETSTKLEDLDKKIEDVNSDFITAINAIGDAISGLGADVPQGADLDMITNIIKDQLFHKTPNSSISVTGGSNVNIPGGAAGIPITIFPITNAQKTGAAFEWRDNKIFVLYNCTAIITASFHMSSGKTSAHHGHMYLFIYKNGSSIKSIHSDSKGEIDHSLSSGKVSLAKGDYITAHFSGQDGSGSMTASNFKLTVITA